MSSTRSKRKERYRPGMNRPMPMKDPAQLPNIVATLIANDRVAASAESELPKQFELSDLPELPEDAHLVWISKAVAFLSVMLLAFALYKLLWGTL